MATLGQYIKKREARAPGFKARVEEAKAGLDLAVELTRLREQRGWTQQQFADKVGMPQSTIARYEKAARRPSVTTLQKLLTTLNATVMLCPGYRLKVIDSEPEGQAPTRWATVPFDLELRGFNPEVPSTFRHVILAAFSAKLEGPSPRWFISEPSIGTGFAVFDPEDRAVADLADDVELPHRNFRVDSLYAEVG